LDFDLLSKCGLLDKIKKNLMLVSYNIHALTFYAHLEPFN
jgi:hypothetical protein